MIQLHHCVSARSFRVLWMLEELGLAYELKMLPFPPRVHAKSFLAINPLGTVPAFFDHDHWMTESSAIAQYLAARYGKDTLDVPVDSPDYASYLQWCYFGEATLTFPQTLVLRYGRFEPDERKQPQVAEDYAKWFLARLRGVQAVVESEPWLVGGRFSAADVSVGYALMLADLIGLSERFPAGIAAYWERLQARDAFVRSLAIERDAAIAHGISPVPAPRAGADEGPFLSPSR